MGVKMKRGGDRIRDGERVEKEGGCKHTEIWISRKRVNEKGDREEEVENAYKRYRTEK